MFWLGFGVENAAGFFAGVVFLGFGFFFALSLPPSASPPSPLFWRPAWVFFLLLLSARPAGLRRTSATWSGGSSTHVFVSFLLSLPGSVASTLSPSVLSLSLSLSLCKHALRALSRSSSHTLVL